MSAKCMNRNLSVVWRPSFVVSVAIISEPKARISFKFLLCLQLGHKPRHISLFFYFFICLRIFFVFANMGHSGSENFKTLFLLQITVKSFQTFPEFSSQSSSQSTVLDSWKIEFTIFNAFSLFWLTWDPTGAKSPKRFSSLKSLYSPDLLLKRPQKVLLWVLEILRFWHLTIFFQKFQIYHCNLWRNKKTP